MKAIGEECRSRYADRYPTEVGGKPPVGRVLHQATTQKNQKREMGNIERIGKIAQGFHLLQPAERYAPSLRFETNCKKRTETKTETQVRQLDFTNL